MRAREIIGEFWINETICNIRWTHARLALRNAVANELEAHFAAVHESESGPKLTCRTVKQMSDVEGEADIKSCSRHFRC